MKNKQKKPHPKYSLMIEPIGPTSPEFEKFVKLFNDHSEEYGDELVHKLIDAEKENPSDDPKAKGGE